MTSLINSQWLERVFSGSKNEDEDLVGGVEDWSLWGETGMAMSNSLPLA